MTIRIPFAAVLLIAAAAHSASACPFCTALKPTLSQRRESASVVALVECLPGDKEAAHFRLHQALRGKELLAGRTTLDVAVELALKPGTLAVLFADGKSKQPLEKWNWTAEKVNETSLGYFVGAPPLTKPAAERLRYFARYLEHPEPLVAEDAWQEFGHAPYDQVAQVADALSADKLRGWLGDPGVPAERKGFYGVALGLAGGAGQRQANATFLRQLVLAPADDFRAGFDGILGGYLVAGGCDALEVLEERYLKNPQAADGDLRHLVTALRFYLEFGQEIPQPRLNAAMRQLLDRPEFAAAAIVDLARWRDWAPVERIAGLYSVKRPMPLATRRAIVGYLLACPAPAAAEQLSRLRKLDPQGVEQATASLALPLGRTSGQ
jgi:hypothetical protein